MIHVRELMPEDAPAVARLESRFHDRALTDEPEAHRQRLADALAEGVNLSFGAFDDDTLVGYVLCYGFEPTAFADEEGTALYIEDVTVEPKYRTALARLLKRFVRDINAHFPGVWIEAHAVEDALPVWLKHSALFAQAGFPMQRYVKTGEQIGGQERYVLRWRAPATGGDAELEQVLDRLPAYPMTLGDRSYVLKLVRQESDWAALETLWDALLLATPNHTVFQCYKYQRLWWRHFGDDSELLIVVILLGNAVVGIAPLRIAAVKHYGRYRRQLGFVGSRWEVDRPQLLFPERSAELVRVLVRFLVGQKGRWDIGDFYEQPAGSDASGSLGHEFRAAGLLVGRLRDSECPYLELTGTWQEFRAGKSPKLRKNLKASRRRLAEAGNVEYRAYDTLPQVGEQLELYRELEKRGWKDEEGVGVGRDGAYFAFYEEMAQAFAASGAFTVRMLGVGGRAVAGTFGLAFDGVYYSLQITHDRELDRCSPGTYLESLEIEDCFGRSYREYEFLGGFLRNKSRWTSTHRHTVELYVYRRTPFLTLLYVLLFRVKPWVKELIRPFMRSWPREPLP
jgi:CelD/BcsL family acetyltransferase involved in cellulose biosynthesis